MRKRVWIHSPVVFVLLGVILAMALFQYFAFEKRGGVILLFQIVCVVAAVAAVVFGEVNFRSYVKKSLASVGKVMTGVQKEALEEFSVPTLVVGEREDVVWFNPAFAHEVAHADFVAGADIHDFLSGHSVDEVPDEGLDVEYGGRRYTAFANRVVSESQFCYLVYFIDNTYYKDTTDRYERTRPAAAVIVFDNLDEISKSLKASEVSRICAEIEEKIEGWISAKGGLVNKVSTGRYVVFWEKQALEKAIESRFDLLDAVRNIPISDQMNATLSIGVGCAGDSFRECYEMAGQSLDMALGRGGDQAVLRMGSEYKFFGGVSKGVEKRSRVRARVIASALGSMMQECDNVLIMGHRNSDMDCIGAAVGIWAIAHKVYEKPARIVIDRQTTVAKSVVENFERENRGAAFIAPEQSLSMITENTLLVIVDTHSNAMLDHKEVYQKAKKVVVIDHHRKMVNYIDNAVIFYHEPFASSASEMVTELVEYLSENCLDPLEAGVILAGIMLDTKNFVLKTGVRTFEAAAFLRRKGADTVEVKRLFADSAEDVKMRYQFVQNAEIVHGMAVSVSREEGKDLRVTAAQAADELLGISGVDASFVLFPLGNGINVSARSFGRVNVQLIMEKVGGGGHLTMAGAQFPNSTPEDAKKRILEAISEYMREHGQRIGDKNK